MKFQFLCSFVPFYIGQNHTLCLRIASLLQKAADHIYKFSVNEKVTSVDKLSSIFDMSDYSCLASIKRCNLGESKIFFDIEGLYGYYGLTDEIDCPNFDAAIVYWLTLHPMPPEVFNFLPNFESFFDLTIPINQQLKIPLLNSDSRLLIRNLISHKSDDGQYQHTKDNGTHIFFNYQADFYSCATRALKILGLETLVTEWGVDVHKYGLGSDVFIERLQVAWSPGVVLVHSDTFCEGDLQLRDLHRFKWHQMGNLINQVSAAPAWCVVIVQNDHVSFSIKDSILSEQCIIPVFKKTNNSSDLFSPDYISLLHQHFPPVSGRAGAKVFIKDLDYIPKLAAMIEEPHLLKIFLDRLLAMRDHNWGMTTIHGLLLSILVDEAGSDLLIYYAFTPQLCTPLIADAAKLLKMVHTTGRLYYTLSTMLRKYYPVYTGRSYARSIYGLDTLVGRSEKLPLDSAGEMLMRTVDPFRRGKLEIGTLANGMRYLHYDTDGQEYTRYMSVLTKQSFEALIKEKTHAESFRHWFSRRMFWGASGGSPGAKVTWKDDEKLRLNKRGALIALKPYRVEKLWKIARSLSGKKVIQFSKSTKKFESGKLRAILNTSVENYVSQGYIQDIFHENVRDDIWYSYGHSTSGRIANAIRRLSDVKLRTPLMWDYSDFNINHTYVNMALGYLYTGKVIINRMVIPRNSKLYEEIVDNISDDIRYIIQARFNTYLADDELGIMVKAVRSLQSGERATSDINTTQNDIAVRLMDDASKRLFGFSVIHSVGDRAGDDAFLTAKSLLYGSLACALFNLTGEAGQVYKINMNAIRNNALGSISTINSDRLISSAGSGEFLRLSYDGATNEIRGYPLRAMMGFIHGEFFAEPIPDPPSRAATLLEQVSKLHRRGWHTPDWLFTKVFKSTCTLVFTTDAGIKKRFTPDLQLVTMPRAFGGYGVSETNEGLPVSIDARNGFVTQLTAKMAIYIPSGEGKTMLARQYPQYFIDHDTLVDPFVFKSLRERAMFTGKWDAVNTYLAEIAAEYVLRPNEHRVLLSWGPATTPRVLHSASIAIMFRNANGIRANVANRASIRAAVPRQLLHYVRTRGNLVSIALSLVSSLLNGGNTWIVTHNGNTSSPPVYKPPAISSLSLLKNSKPYEFVDAKTLHQQGLNMPPDVGDAIVNSALTGGWPKEALNQSLADYARELTTWSAKTTIKTSLMRSIDIIDTNKVASLVHNILSEHLGLTGFDYNSGTTTFKLNKEGYPLTKRLRHSYNCLSAYMRPFGCSVLPTMYHLIENQPGHTTLFKLYKLVDMHITRYEQGRLEVEKLKELRDICKLFISSKYSGTPTITKRASDKSEFSEALHQFGYKWIDGKLDFIPSYNPGVATDIMSYSRDVTLTIIEQHANFMLMAQLPAHIMSISVHKLERIVTLETLKILNKYCPGVIFKD